MALDCRLMKRAQLECVTGAPVSGFSVSLVNCFGGYSTYIYAYVDMHAKLEIVLLIS